MKFIAVKSYDDMSEIAANLIAAQVICKPTSVLGFATGSTPVGTYEKLIDRYEKGLLDFSSITTFNLDEYCGLTDTDPNSYHCFMMDNLFSHINTPVSSIHLPSGIADDMNEECERYDKAIEAAGGIDLQLLGIGNNGHIGFNEPDDIFHNNTWVVELAESTIEANKRFFEDSSMVPRSAVTMGIKTIMSAKQVIMLAGPEKAPIVNELRKNICTPAVPASILHYHQNCLFIYVES